MSRPNGYFVEFLPRIGTTSIVIWGLTDPYLKYSDSDEIGKILAQDKEGERLTILLPHKPGNIKSNTLVKLDASTYLLTLKSYDVQIDKSSNDMLSLPPMKWNKGYLKKLGDFTLCCIRCNTEIIGEANCRKLNEMPSEFWMELMDFWHCHKPQDKSSGYYSLQKNSLAPSLNELLIGDAFFQALEETFKNIVVTGDQGICCNCKETLGRRNGDRMLRIPKWKLRLRYDDHHDDVFPPECEVISILLNCNKANSTRYVLLRCNEDGKQIYIWLFATGIAVTLSSGKILQNSLKIFYSDTIPATVGLKANVDEEQVDKIPFKKFIDALETTNSLLPSNKRRFKTWKISYLPMEID